MKEIFLATDALTITFKQWVNELQSTLETLIQKIPNFIDHFCDQIGKLLIHDFMCRQQTDFIKKMNETLKEGEFLVQMDFAEILLL